jgi:hypothetical protein
VPVPQDPSSPTAHLWVIEALKRNSKRKSRWYPLFMYRTEFEARIIYNLLIAAEDAALPAGAEDSEDFRLRPPAEEQPVRRKKSRGHHATVETGLAPARKVGRRTKKRAKGTA